MTYTDRELEMIPYSQLLRIMVAHVEAHDKRVKESPDEFEWNMGLWAYRHIKCHTCLAGAMLYDRVGAEDCFSDGAARKAAEGWMCRVDNLRTGFAIPVAELDLEKWFKENQPAISASRGDPWNSEEDGAFYREFADKLEEIGA